jgi:hypothetical protein
MIQQSDLVDPVRNLNLSEEQAGHLGSGLLQGNLLTEETRTGRNIKILFQI